MQLPAPEIIAKAAEEKAKAESKVQEQAQELQRLRDENKALRERYEKHTKNFVEYVTNKNNRENKSKYKFLKR